MFLADLLDAVHVAQTVTAEIPLETDETSGTLETSETLET